ncbi:MAG: hypothetical protein QM680_13710 [Luteolibacter sp.]
MEDPETGEVIPNPNGFRVLKRDGVTVVPLEPMFEKMLIQRRITHYNGPEAECVNFLDFLCPMDAETIQDADCVAHVYDMPVMNLADRWRRDQVAQGAEASMEAKKKAIDLIQNLADEGGEAKSAQAAYRPEQNTWNQSVNRDPVAKIAEFYLRYDADGDGLMEEIMLVLDLNSRTPIFYDYVANVTPDGLRPFSVVRVNEMSGRWYGIGGMEMFETTQNIVDLAMNRWNFSESGSGVVKFWKPHNTMEGQANPYLRLNNGETYTPRGNMTGKDCLDVVDVHQGGKNINLREMIEFFTQMATNESGVANANDSRAAGLDTGRLATGIRNIERSGQEMFSLYLNHLEPGVTDVLRRMIRLVRANLDENEVMTYFEDGPNGEPEKGALVKVSGKDLMDVDLDVEILLSRYRGEQVIESSGQAVEIVEKFYSLPFMVQQVTAQLYRDMLRALQVQNADQLIQPIDLPPMPPGRSVNPQIPQQRPRVAGPNL